MSPRLRKPAATAGFAMLAAGALAAPPDSTPGGSADFWLAWLLGIAVLIALNSVYIAAETALTNLRGSHARLAREENERTGRKLQTLVDRRATYIASTLLASRLIRLGQFFTVLVAAPAVAALLFHSDGTTYSETLASSVVLGVPVVLTNLLLGELLPKSYALLHPHRVAALLYQPIQVAALLLSLPATILVRLANLLAARFGGKAGFGSGGVAEEEIKSIAETAEESGQLEPVERELIHSALEFGDRVAKEIMTPRVDMDALPVKSDPAELLKLIRESGHSRIPLYEETDDQIVGIVHAKDILVAISAGRPYTLRQLMRPPLFVPEGKALYDVLRDMRTSRSEMAIIHDEFGGTAGIVTSEDIVEEVVGEIVDEYDQEESTLVQSGHEWIVYGRTHVDEVNETLGSEFESEEFDTIGGLVFGHFGRQPQVGESIEFDGYHFTVDQTDGRRIKRLRLERIDLIESDHEETSEETSRMMGNG